MHIFVWSNMPPVSFLVESGYGVLQIDHPHPAVLTHTFVSPSGILRR